MTLVAALLRRRADVELQACELLGIVRTGSTASEFLPGPTAAGSFFAPAHGCGAAQLAERCARGKEHAAAEDSALLCFFKTPT